MATPFFDPPEQFLAPIKELLDQGLGYRRIAAEYGCDKNTVRLFVRKHFPDVALQHALEDVRPAEMRVLIIDIETRPGEAFIWSQKEPWIPYERIQRDPEPICFAAQWLDGEMEFWSVWDHGKSAMVTRAHALLSEAHAVVTYNGARFDLPHLNLEFLRNGMAPPKPYKSVDLYQTTRRKFRFTSNKLGHVGDKLEIGSKMEHEGFALWEKVMAGDRDAQARMRAYNEEDVRLTERLYREILPWIEQHPSYASLSESAVCPNCGGELREAGEYRTKTGVYHQYQCVGCGHWARDTHRHATTTITETGMS